MIEGMIISSIAGYYHVQTDQGLFLCKPRGIFRKEKRTPAVGDRVRILPEQNEGTIEYIYSRMSLLTRPFVANVSYALLQFSIRDPSPDLLLLDTLILNSLVHGITPIILFNKTDLTDQTENERYQAIYQASGIAIHFLSVLQRDGLDYLKQTLGKGIYVLAGQSGVGKSSLINALADADLTTGQISDRLGRGKHTTRHTSLLKLREEVYLVDTPGFQNLDIEEGVSLKDVVLGYPEMEEYAQCQYYNCLHDREPKCGVKQAVKERRIHETRYENYVKLLNELRLRKDY